MRAFMTDWAHRALMWAGYLALTFSGLVMAHG